MPNFPPHIKAGQPATGTVLSERWWAQFYDAVGASQNVVPTGRGVKYRAGQYDTTGTPYDASVRFQPVKNIAGTAVALEDRRIFHARPVNAFAEDEPTMRASLAREMSCVYTNGPLATNSEGMFYGYPIGDDPVEVKVDKDSTKHWITGLPCGRKHNSDILVPEAGGLILLKEPNDSGFAWVVRDTVQIWDAVIIKKAGSSYPITDGTDKSYRQRLVIGMIRNEVGATDDQKDIVTGWRGELVFRDTNEADQYADGTRVRVDYKHGEWRLVWGGCNPVAWMSGLAEVVPL